MTKLLKHKPHIHPDYYNAEVTLADGWEQQDGIHAQFVQADISEHAGGRLSLMLSKDDGTGRFVVINLTSEATEVLRQALNRAHRERQRQRTFPRDAARS